MEIALAVIPLASTYALFQVKTALTLRQGAILNYRGQPVSNCGGIVLYFSYILAALWRLLFTGAGLLETAALLYLVSGLAILGLVDDVWGDSRHKGFKGHFRLLLSDKEMSTGFIKALFGAVLAFSAAALVLQGVAKVLVGGAVIALATNTVNSLDLRPGRALKFFLAASLAIIVLSQERGAALLLLPFLAAILVYLPFELRETVMLGDSGANVLGGALGFAFIAYFPLRGQLAALMILLLFQVFCEVYSVSELILRSKILRFMDDLGRVFKGEKEHEQ